MDMFIKLYNVVEDEYVFLNKNDIEFISVKDNVAGIVMNTSYINVHFLEDKGIHLFMRAIEGLLYETPRVTINFVKGEDK